MAGTGAATGAVAPELTECLTPFEVVGLDNCPELESDGGSRGNSTVQKLLDIKAEILRQVSASLVEVAAWVAKSLWHGTVQGLFVGTCVLRACSSAAWRTLREVVEFCSCYVATPSRSLASLFFVHGCRSRLRKMLEEHQGTKSPRRFCSSLLYAT